MEHPKRSFVKALTWRVMGFVTTMAIVYFYTSNIKEAFFVGLGIDGSKIIFFYINERIWNRVNFGRAKVSNYQI